MTVTSHAAGRPTTGVPPIRVLVVEEGVGLWGAQRYLLRLAPLLEERGVEQVLAAPLDGDIAGAWAASGRRVIGLKAPGERSVRSGGDEGRLSATLLGREAARAAAAARRLARLAHVADASVIHANSHWGHLEAALAGRFSRRTVVLHLHEETLPGVAGHLRALAVRTADASIAVSAAVAGCVPGWARARVNVIRNGVDTRHFVPGPAEPALRAEMSADPSAPLVLVMCRLDPRKGVDHVIRAVAGLAPEIGPVHLAIAGSGALDPDFADHLRSLGDQLLGGRVRFLGAREDVDRLLRAADILALGSSLEGLPLGVLEAQACGTPVVAYPTAGIPEIVVDGQTGLLARPGDVDHLSTRIADLLSSPELRHHIAQAARRQVERRFSLETQADEQVTLLRRLASASDVAAR